MRPLIFYDFGRYRARETCVPDYTEQLPSHAIIFVQLVLTVITILTLAHKHIEVTYIFVVIIDCPRLPVCRKHETAYETEYDDVPITRRRYHIIMDIIILFCRDGFKLRKLNARQTI